MIDCTIITPCSRPENLSEMSKHIPTECQWVIVYDQGVKPENVDAQHYIPGFKDKFGNELRNYGIEKSESEWLYFLDDDNIIHADWWDSVKDIKTDSQIITWGQLNKDNSVRLNPTDTPKVNRIDTACYMVRKSDKRWNDKYQADGYFAQEHTPVHMINKYLSYYNYLR